MTRQQIHDQQKALIIASLLLADTRAERHGTYPIRRPRRKVHAWTLPVVNEKRPL